jgi:hypothetical protein
VGKSPALLIVLGGAFLVAWLILGIGFLHRLAGWQLSALGLLGPVGILLVVLGVAIARRRTRA